MQESGWGAPKHPSLVGGKRLELAKPLSSLEPKVFSDAQNALTSLPVVSVDVCRSLTKRVALDLLH